jgi:osmotically-inducible protein OsmY
VSEALQKEGLAAPDVIVSIHASAIVLTGKVKNDAQAAHVISLAETAAAGTRVTGKLEIQPAREAEIPVEAAAESAQLAHQVQDALLANRATAKLGIVVNLHAQQVIGLFGLVPSEADRMEAERVALDVPGVKRVENRLLVPGEQEK